MDSELRTRILHTSTYVIRLVLLIPLIAGLLMVGAAVSPLSRTLADFRGAALAGEIDRVHYRTGDSEDWVTSLSWSDSPLSWHRIEGEFSDQEGPYTTTRLMADLRHTDVWPILKGTPSNDGPPPDWVFESPGGWWIAGPWLIAFLTMLFTTPRLANRWAWFWLFTVGDLGAIFWLLLEPRPLWRGPGEGLPRAKRVDGCSGCVLSILMAIVWGLTAMGIGRLVELVLSW
ncbi:hypothetical protein AB0I81_10210 [Nonomuraea sp. NPDC050404]|uniref:hypothetical protein n=1 Tax=Nonomuraea sp. NPDC050404 TaxID=3155783 RepID=UPI0033D5340C